MRKIVPESVLHNATARRFRRAGSLGLVLACLLGGCSADTKSDRASVDQDDGPECGMIMDTSAWHAFTDFADRIAAGQNVTKQEFDAFGELPTLTLWRQSLGPDVPGAIRVGNWLEATFWKDLGREGEQKRSADRATFMKSYRYSLTNRERIDERLAHLTGPGRCIADSLARFWIAPGKMPAQVTAHFLPAQAEIRIHEGQLLVDTGVVGAVDRDQVPRQMASLLFRKYQAPTGDSPLSLAGEEAVAHAFRVMTYEGMAGWIERAADMHFDSKHPELYKVQIVPETFFAKAQETVDLFHRFLGGLLEDPEVMADKGQPFARQLAAMNAYAQTGYAMAAVISAHLGEEALRDASRSPASFVAAYQKAALLNDVPVPTPGTLGTELYQTVKPLDPDLFTRLHALLERHFPVGT